MFSTISDIFNTREIAIAIIAIFIIGYVLSKSNIEIFKSFKGVLKAFFSKKIITPIIIMFIYSFFLVYILNVFGLWENHQIKNYIYWLIVVGVLTHFQKDTYSFKTVFKETLSLIVIFQFILTFYTFNLFFELLFILIVSILSITKIFIEKDTEANQSAIKVIDSLLLFIGLIMIFLTAKEYIYNFDEFADSKTLYDFFVPTFLSIMIIPYFYLFFIFVTYESSFISLSYAIKDKELLKYAKLKGILAFNFDRKSFEKWAHNLISYDISKETIKQSIQDIKQFNKMKKNIHDIDIKIGWHPFLANSFLKDYDIYINDYRRSYNGLWSGISNYMEIKNENSHIVYRIEGTLEYVNKLEVQLFFYVKDKINIEKSYSYFVNMCNDLSLISINYELSEDIINSLISDNNLNTEFHDKQINIIHESFETGAYKLIFSINSIK